jgi:release factor glutamine methyltransferase
MSVVSSEPAVWTIETVLRWATEDFRSRGFDSPRLDAELLLARALSTTRIRLIIESKRTLGQDELARTRGLIKRRRAREPVAYILGVREFFGFPFRVDTRVLVPRPDSEVLVEVALERTRSLSLCMRAVDLCTGSGCVAVSLARHRPTTLIVGTDISAEALEVARDNVLRLGAYNVGLACSDLFEVFSPEQRFDLITANPPYVASPEIESLAPEVRDHEPRLALDGGSDGLEIVRRIVFEAAAYLTPGGVLAIEVGAGQAPRVAPLFAEAGYADIQTKRDYASIERVVSGVLQHAPAPGR